MQSRRVLLSQLLRQRHSARATDNAQVDTGPGRHGRRRPEVRGVAVSRMWDSAGRRSLAATVGTIAAAPQLRPVAPAWLSGPQCLGVPSPSLLASSSSVLLLGDPCSDAHATAAHMPCLRSEHAGRKVRRSGLAGPHDVDGGAVVVFKTLAFPGMQQGLRRARRFRRFGTHRGVYRLEDVG